MSVMPIMPGAVRQPWPTGALPCPNCGNHAEILLGDVQNVEHYQCPCGFFSMRSGGYTAEVRGWNEDVRDWKRNKKTTINKSKKEKRK